MTQKLTSPQSPSLIPKRSELRDYFAGLAMQGLVSGVETEPNGEFIARHSYAVADAMLARRLKKAD